jgi:hypothetical protein
MIKRQSSAKSLAKTAEKADHPDRACPQRI